MPGGGFGALDTFNKTLKKNRELLKKVKIFERIKPYNKGLKDASVREFGTSTPEQLEYYKEKALQEDRKHGIKRTVVIITTIVIIAVMILFLIIKWGAL